MLSSNVGFCLDPKDMFSTQEEQQDGFSYHCYVNIHTLHKRLHRMPFYHILIFSHLLLEDYECWDCYVEVSWKRVPYLSIEGERETVALTAKKQKQKQKKET